jgi:hypothetical protein
MKSKRFEEHRDQLNLSATLPKELTIKIASTVEEYKEAYKIIYDCYIEKGYTNENAHGIRATPYHLLPSTTLVLALWDEEIIGTISLIRDNPLGLPLEAIFNLESFRKEQKALCEVSSFAIKKNFRGKGGEIFYPIMRYMWNYSLHYFGIDYFVIAVNPSMHELYESIFLFQPLMKNNVIETYDFANNNPAVGQFIDVKNSYQILDEQYGDRPFHKNISLYLQQKDIPNYQYPKRKFCTHIDSPATPQWMELFNQYIPQLQNEVTRKRISNAFGYKNENEMNMSSVHNRNRVPVTFEVLNFPKAKIIDVSEKGFKMISQYEFSLSTPVVLKLQLSKDVSTTVLAQPVWKKDCEVYGFQIIKQSKKWNLLIQDIYPSSVPVAKVS